VKKRPNILVFIVDQLRCDSLGCNDNPRISTPNIDSLAAKGTSFDNAYVCQPVCTPQRNSMLTGLYPSAHGCARNGIALDESFPVYPELLRQSGYQTFASGKMHLSPISRGFDDPPYEPGEAPDEFPYYGFEEVEFIEGEESGYVKMLNQHGFDCKNPNELLQFVSDGPYQTCVDPIPENLHRTTYVADKAIDFIEKRDSGKPFLLHCSFWDPHHPFAVPEPYDKVYDPEKMQPPIPYEKKDFAELPVHFKACHEKEWDNHGASFKDHDVALWKKMKAHYYGMISLIDKNVGRVIESLRKNNVEDDTVVIFVSDHGELLGDHGLALKGSYHYQSLIKVPLIIKIPGQNNAGKRIGEPMMSYDIMPTILEFAGVAPPERITAKSLNPFFEGRGQGREAILVEAPDARTIVKGNLKMIYHLKTGEGQLYDLSADPDEKVNLWNERKDLKAELFEAALTEVARSKMPARQPIGPW